MFVLFTVVFPVLYHIMATGKHESDEQHFRLCVPPCPRFIMSGDTHSLCVACLGAEHARSALEGELPALCSSVNADAQLSESAL